MTLNKEEFKTLMMLYIVTEADEKCSVIEEQMVRGMRRALE